MKEYGLYDVKNYEQCVRIGTLKEIAIHLKCSSNSLRSYLSRRKIGKQNLLKRRYELIEIQEKEIEEQKRKSDKEIFEEMLKIFTGGKKIITLKEQIAKFKVFDEFNWIIKGMKDKVIVEEEWKKIRKFDYSISNYGRIRNEKNKKIKSVRYHRWIIQTDIYKDGKRYTIDVARLEANLFIRNLNENERVRHIDGDIRNNYYKNLEIVSK